MAEKNGFDRYLEFYYGQVGSFYTALWAAIAAADRQNSMKLSLAFPEEVKAYRFWTEAGLIEFRKYITPGCHYLDDLDAEIKRYEGEQK